MMFGGIFRRNPHCLQLHYRPTVVYSAVTKELADFVFWGLMETQGSCHSLALILLVCSC